MDKHPADVQVASFIYGQLDDMKATELRNHLRRCSFCNLRIGQAEWDDLVNVTEPLKTPIPILPAQEFENRDSPPSLGDVWRLVWDNVNELGVIDELDIQNQRVVVFPILPNIDDADEWCGLTTLNVLDQEFDVAVSVALSTSIPWFVLDARVGHVEQFEHLRQLRIEFKRDEMESGIPRGLPIQSEFDRRIDSIGDIGDAFHDLAEAEWGAISPKDVTEHSFPSLDALVELDIPIHRALSLVRGEVSPSIEELEVIGVNTDVSHWTLPLIPDALRQELNLPRWRPALRRRATENHTLEAKERVAVALEARQPVAARGTHGKPVEWRLLLERLLV